jgi:hypothetical protein
MFLHLLLVCTVSIGISLLTGSEIISTMVSFLLVLGLDNAFDFRSYFSSQGRFTYIFGYFEQLTHLDSFFMLTNSPVTVEEVAISIAIPILVTTVGLTTAFIYFTRKMEID